MNTAKGELSFVVSGVNLGVVYDGIPLSCLMFFFTVEVIQ